MVIRKGNEYILVSKVDCKIESFSSFVIDVSCSANVKISPRALNAKFGLTLSEKSVLIRNQNFTISTNVLDRFRFFFICLINGVT